MGEASAEGSPPREGEGVGKVLDRKHIPKYRSHIYKDCNLIYTDRNHIYKDRNLIYTDRSFIYKNRNLIYTDRSYIYKDRSLIYTDRSHIYKDRSLIYTDRSHIYKDRSLIYTDRSYIYKDRSLIYTDRNRTQQKPNSHQPQDNFNPQNTPNKSRAVAESDKIYCSLAAFSPRCLNNSYTNPTKNLTQHKIKHLPPKQTQR